MLRGDKKKKINKGICCGYPFELHRLVTAIQMSTHNICFYKENQTEKICINIIKKKKFNLSSAENFTQNASINKNNYTLLSEFWPFPGAMSITVVTGQLSLQSI